MDISPLDIKLVRQHPGSEDCLRCCAQMVFSFFDDSISNKELWKKLHVYKKHSGLSGGYLADLGLIGLKRNYQVTISHYAWDWWDKNTVDAVKNGKQPLVKALRSLKKKKKDWSRKKQLNKEISFVKAGGLFKFELPALENINFHLNRKVPVIISVRGEDLYHSPKEFSSHIIVIIGKKDSNYIIRDPYMAINKVAGAELLHAWTRNSGWMMSMVPKEKKTKAQQVKLKF